jgi:hypothetical protein
MPDEDLDRLFGEVFATPAGQKLIDELKTRDYPLSVAEIDIRVTKMRARWGTGAPRE